MSLVSNRDRLKEELGYLNQIVSEEKNKIRHLEKELNDSEEHNQMNNLEKRWNNQQQTNQVQIFHGFHKITSVLGNGRIHFKSYYWYEWSSTAMSSVSIGIQSSDSRPAQKPNPEAQQRILIFKMFLAFYFSMSTSNMTQPLFLYK